MDIFVEIKDKDRKTCDKYLAAVDKAKEFIKGELRECKNFNCGTCNKPITQDFRPACRIVKGKKGVLVHPVHKDCVKDTLTGEALLANKNNTYTDMSVDDVVNLIKTIESLKRIGKQ